MNLNGKNIEDWFIGLEKSKDFSKFPHSDNYPAKYKTISNELYKWVHSEVDIGALNSENSLNSKIFLIAGSFFSYL